MHHILNKKTSTLVLILAAVSAGIYALQILFFHDPGTTFFYIFQDLAFIPISIAITTVVVGSIMDERSKRDSRAKTRMLMGTFFSGIGAKLMVVLLRAADHTIAAKDAMASCYSRVPEEERIERIRQTDFNITLDQETYDQTRELLEGWETELMILSSNPLLLEHETFTELLFGLFQLMDEFRLRGNYENLNEDAVSHMGEDFSRVLRLLLLCAFENRKYTQENFPVFYRDAAAKIKTRGGIENED
ncbi:MAG: hypothetical protein PUC44_06395 [Eubacteriales bacterium]|nr:hypothetical protein [Eubacteriales bacterium]